MCNINSVVTVLYYILSNVQQTKTIFFSDRNFVTVLILILGKLSTYFHMEVSIYRDIHVLHNHSISSFKFLKNKLVATDISKNMSKKWQEFWSLKQMDLAKVDKILPLCRYVPLDIRLPLSKEPLSAMTPNNFPNSTFFHLRKWKEKSQLQFYFSSTLLRVCKFSQNCVKEWMCKERLNLKSTHDLTFLKCVTEKNRSRTTDAQRGNSLHCTAENSLPLPNF